VTRLQAATVPRPGELTVLTPLATPRLLSGPDLDGGAETFESHYLRLGRRPRGGAWMIDELERSGLRGRGGGSFPTFRKWRGVAKGAETRSAVVVVNASEGEPLSGKDRSLLRHRPHLVLDGAMLAAETVGADEVVVYLNRASRDAARAVRLAMRERRITGVDRVGIRMVLTAHRYVAGESSSVVRRVSGGQSKPQFAPPHPSTRGVNGRPTLVQNAETLAHAALVGRFGPSWFRERGTDELPGTAMITLIGNVAWPGVYEIDVGSTLSSALGAGGGVVAPPGGALVGGYFGSWLAAADLDCARLGTNDLALGCGVVGVLDDASCGIAESARIVTYLARESAGQCGPCVFGLRAIAETMTRVAASQADRGDLARLNRWTAMVRGRGGCRHPDGAISNVVSALEAFAGDLDGHLRGRHCAGWQRASLPAPRPHRGWR
jgi:NADH:ubiquinone oxidoreductase subunit F (NADH-binding)